MIESVNRAAGSVRLPLVLGLTDGLLNALTLAASSILGTGGPISYTLAARVGTTSLVTAAFAMFVTDYAERRAQLVHVSRQLSLTASGRMAGTRLGRLALGRSLRAMGVACVCSFVGAALPLVLGVLLPVPSWVVIDMAHLNA
ncbi:hypothetical protein ACFV85_22095 [Streptomyces niveus]|uniref:hypothetical protein n=1 Tax=Streptomyces niveus TaxID=193462 RepID=UPI003651ED10